MHSHRCFLGCWWVLLQLSVWGRIMQFRPASCCSSCPTPDCPCAVLHRWCWVVLGEGVRGNEGCLEC